MQATALKNDKSNAPKLTAMETVEFQDKGRLKSSERPGQASNHASKDAPGHPSAREGYRMAEKNVQGSDA